jgi:hypothetical protein
VNLTFPTILGDSWLHYPHFQSPQNGDIYLSTESLFLHIIIAIHIPYSICQNWFRGTFAGHLSIALQQKLGLDFQHRDILGYLSSRGNLGLVTG